MDIRAYNQRIESLKQKSDQLEDENFHDIDTITKRYVLRFRTTFSYSLVQVEKSVEDWLTKFDRESGRSNFH